MKQAQILSGAFTVWQKSMFTRTSLTPLAQELGISKAAIYRYFPSKESLINTMEDFFAEKYREHSEDMLKILTTGSLHNSIEGYTRELIAFLSSHPGFFRFFISRLYHHYQREALPFWPILTLEALHLQDRFTAAGIGTSERTLCVRYFYTHVLSWAHILISEGLEETDISGYVPTILTSYFEGFTQSGLPEVPYETLEQEILILLIPRFMELLKNNDCRSFGLEPEKLMGILWFQLIREIMAAYGDTSPGPQAQENTELLRTLEILFCEGLKGLERRYT